MMKTDLHSGKLLSPPYFSCTLQACIEHAAGKHYMHHCNLLIWWQLISVPTNLYSMHVKYMYLKYNIFNGRSLITIDRKVDTWFCTHVRWFAAVVSTRFSFYKYQNVSKSIPANIVSCMPANILSWSGKTIVMLNYWPSLSVQRWISVVRIREIRNMVLLSTFGLLLTCFLFWIPW